MFLAAALSLALGSLPPWAEGGASRPEDVEVWIATFSPGDDLTQYWGHSAPVVVDNRLGQARLYNFGMFGFDSTFIQKFVRGRLEFWVGEAPVEPTFEYYKSENRDVRVQVLNLPPDKALGLAQALARNVLPENSTYLYQHYTDNCSTRPRDMFDKAYDGALLRATQGPARMSIREHTRRYSMVNPLMSWTLDYLQNDDLDKPIKVKDEAFLPDELEKQLDELVLTRPDGTTAPAVRKKFYWFKSTRAPTAQKPPEWTAWWALLGGALGALAVLLARFDRQGKLWARLLLGLEAFVLGCGTGLISLIDWCAAAFTDHAVAYWNENLLQVQPLSAAAVVLGVVVMVTKTRGRRALRFVYASLFVCAVAGLLLKLFPAADQNNWNVIAGTLPLWTGMAGAFWPYQRATSTT